MRGSRTRAGDEINPLGIMYEMIGPDPERWAAAMRPGRALCSIDRRLMALQQLDVVPNKRRQAARLLGPARTWKSERAA